MADVTNLRSPAEAGLSKLFESARKGFASEQAISREEAFRFFEATGLPSRRVEAFKYTDLRAAITEARSVYEARVAERRIMHRSQTAGLFDPQALEVKQEELRRDLAQFESDRDAKIRKIRGD